MDLLSPILTLIRILTDELRGRHARTLVKATNETKRNLLAMHFAFQRIVDEGRRIEDLLLNRQMLPDRSHSIDEELIRHLRQQGNNVDSLWESLITNRVVLRAFRPNVYRRVQFFVGAKSQGIESLLSRISAEMSVATEDMLAQGMPAEGDIRHSWSHERFLSEPDSGQRSLPPLRIALGEPLHEQQQVLRSLEAAADEFGEFLQVHVSLEDLLFLDRGSNEQDPGPSTSHN